MKALSLRKSILFLILSFILIFSVTYHLEKALAIDEVVDNYTDENKVAGKHLVVRNTTFNAMEIKWGASVVPWAYQRLHNITGSTNDDVTDYQILIKVHYGAGADSGDDVYLNGSCQVDFDDVRFTDSDGTTELDYWLERKVDSDYADFWVKIPSILQSPAVTSFYIGYGFVGSTTSDINATFPIYGEDYESYALETDDPDGWWDVGTGIVRIKNDRVYEGSKSLKLFIASGANWAALNLSQSGDYDSAWTSDGTRSIYYYQYDLVGRWYTQHRDASDTMYINFLCRDDQNDWRYHTGTQWLTIGGVQAPTNDVWKRFERLHRSTDMKWRIQTAYGTGWSNWIAKNVNTNPDGTLGYQYHTTSSPEGDPIWLDLFVIGKYIEPEPTHGGWGSEEAVGPGYKPDGHFYTTNILDGISYNATAVLLNTTIPGGDSITVEFSQDNSTWVLNDWEPIFGGYEAVDLRDLRYNITYFRFNLTDGGADSTPRLYQLRLIHEAPGADGVAEPDYVPYIALGIILLLFGLMIGSRLKQ